MDLSKSSLVFFFPMYPAIPHMGISLEGLG
jgi:hypothetical protein